MGDYEPPVDQLLRIGQIVEFDREQWFDYRTLGIGPEHVPDLIRMTIDKDLNNAENVLAEDVRIWAPIHAWRALTLFNAEPAIPALVSIFADQPEDIFDEWITEELPQVFSEIGPAAIPELTGLLEREEAHDRAREHAAQSLVAIARRHPETREQVVATLTRLLERAEGHSPDFNGWIVSYLMNLKAKESAEVIERAFASGFVDEWICGNWYDAWNELELEGEPPPKPERPRHHIGPNPFLDQSDDPPRPSHSDLYGERIVVPSPPREGWKPVESSSPVERKDRNKERQKLEKKVKGKGKGGKRR